MYLCIACHKAYRKGDSTLLVLLGKHHDRNIYLCEECIGLCGEIIKEKHNEADKEASNG